MNEKEHAGNPASELDKKKTIVASPVPSAKVSESSNTSSDTADQLTPEEQMALYEKELKESDWGHQPC